MTRKISRHTLILTGGRTSTLWQNHYRRHRRATALTRALVLFQLLLLTILLSGQESTAPVTWQGWVQLGQRAYKSMKYPEAAEAFQKALELNSGEVTPHIFLASTLMAQYTPGV